jgi:hypothetical protein
MCIHPEIVPRLRAEVLEHCGVDQAPTYATIRELKYSQLKSKYFSVYLY